MINDIPREHPPEGTLEDDYKLVLNALNNPEYLWRTIGSISRETKLPEGYVDAILSADNEVTRSFLEDSEIIVSDSYRSKSREEIYALRRRFRKEAPFWHRFRAAFNNRAA